MAIPAPSNTPADVRSIPPSSDSNADLPPRNTLIASCNVSGAVAYADHTKDCRTTLPAISPLVKLALAHSIALGVTCFAISLIVAFVSLVLVNASFAAPIRLESVPGCFAHSFIAAMVGDFIDLDIAESILVVAAPVFPTFPKADAALTPLYMPIPFISISNESSIVLSLSPDFLDHSLIIKSLFSASISDSDLLSLPCVFCRSDSTVPVIAFAAGFVQSIPPNKAVDKPAPALSALLPVKSSDQSLHFV